MRTIISQVAWVQVLQEQSRQTQLAHLSWQCEHEHVAWLQVAQVHDAQLQSAQLSVQSLQRHVAHSS